MKIIQNNKGFFIMNNCPFSSENKCDSCNLFSKKEYKCAILLIAENLGTILNINFNDGREKKLKKMIPPEYRETPPITSKPPMNPIEIENFINKKN